MKRERLIFSLAALYVVLMPVSWPRLPFNVQLSDLALLILALCLFLNRAHWTRLAFHPLDGLVGLYLFGSAVALVGHPDLNTGGVALSKQLSLVLVYAVFALLSGHGSLKKKCARSWAQGAIGFSVLALGIGLVYVLLGVHHSSVGTLSSLPVLGTVFRLQGPFLSPEYFGNYLTLSIPIVFGCFRVSSASGVKWGIVLLVSAACWTLSHAVVGFLLAVLLSVWPMCSGKFRFLRPVLVAVCGVVFVGMNAVSIISIREVDVQTDRNTTIEPAPYVYAFDDQGVERVRITLSYQTMSYYLLKRLAWQAFRQNPAKGMGLGEFHTVSEKGYQEGKIHEPYRGMDPHCTLLGRLAETGFVGGLTLLLLWSGFLLAGVKASRMAKSDAWIDQALFFGLVGLFVNSINVDIMNFRFLWVAFGMMRGTWVNVGDDPS